GSGHPTRSTTARTVPTSEAHARRWHQKAIRAFSCWKIGTIGTAETVEQAVLVERLGPLEQASLRFVQRWRASICRSTKNSFPTIPDDSTGFEDPKVASGTPSSGHVSESAQG